VQLLGMDESPPEEKCGDSKTIRIPGCRIIKRGELVCLSCLVGILSKLHSSCSTLQRCSPVTMSLYRKLCMFPLLLRHPCYENSILRGSSTPK
jgi:hypothetical protein